MNRTADKVKDIVEVCPFNPLEDFSADPGRTVAGYHFTDITADLMAKWIDRVAVIRAAEGGAYALAGFRGVGKSHFLSVLAAIISQPELRTRIGDAHVAASAERLSRRHGKVAHVRRGSGTTLLDELRRAIADVVNVEPGTLSESLNELLVKGSEKAGESPLVILIDTALGRDARVSRDDGQFLSEIAAAAKALGIFVGVALDDDIAGADGANLSIAANFTIDYLDQEHLYKIVDTHIFSKHTQKLSVLQDLYQEYRQQLPGFRWSEQRFTSLYPLHPAILEIAPVIRLYVHDFALLGFAAEAGVKILGRPANSLIGLDEVFDGVENDLRGVDALTEAFAAYDRLGTEVAAKAPVHSRLRAKLVLKGLLTLSLNGEGSTAGEIAAAMTISGESQPGILGVEELLDSFAAVMPEIVHGEETDGAAPKYSFKLSAKDDQDQLLAEAAKGVSNDSVWKILLRQTAEKFSDVGDTPDDSLLNIEWRGAIRRGRIDWNSPNHDVSDTDFHVLVDQQLTGESVLKVPVDSLVWKLSPLASGEVDTVKRFHLLQSDAGVREAFGDGLGTAMRLHSVSVEKIWQRIFLLDAKLVDGENEYPFDDGAQAAHNLATLFSAALVPILDARCPLHPEFPGQLDTRRSATLISGFLGGSDQNSPEMQKLAEDFALPLGLAVKSDQGFVPAPIDALLDLGVVKLIMGDEGASTITLDEIGSRLLASPFGLTREAQHMVLGALVAQRQFEFLTTRGDRINHRSLDLQIVWDDIVAIAKPLDGEYPTERLVSWAKLITGNSSIVSMDRNEDRLLIVDSLSSWLRGWRESYTLAGFDELPDANLNATIWKTVGSLRRSFEAMAAAIEALTNDEISLDKCLHTIADLFADSEDDYTKKNSDLRTVRTWTAASAEYNRVVRYLSLCPVTDNAEVEAARCHLLDAIETHRRGAEFPKIWEAFRDSYAAFYTIRHDAAAQANNGLGEASRSDSWRVFESLVSLPQIDRRLLAQANKLVRQGRRAACVADVAAELAVNPHCVCGFDPRDTASDSFADRLSAVTDWCLKFLAEALTASPQELTAALQESAPGAENGELRNNVRQVLEDLATTGFVPYLSAAEIHLIRMAAGYLAATNPRTRRDEFAPALIEHGSDAYTPAL